MTSSILEMMATNTILTKAVAATEIVDSLTWVKRAAGTEVLVVIAPEFLANGGGGSKFTCYFPWIAGASVFASSGVMN